MIYISSASFLKKSGLRSPFNYTAHRATLTFLVTTSPPRPAKFHHPFPKKDSPVCHLYKSTFFMRPFFKKQQLRDLPSYE